MRRGNDDDQQIPAMQLLLNYPESDSLRRMPCTAVYTTRVVPEFACLTSRVNFESGEDFAGPGNANVEGPLSVESGSVHYIQRIRAV